MSSSHQATRQAIETAWRFEAGKIIAAITRLVRDVGLAEELAQDALVAALEHWPKDGLPDNPAAWLMATAKNRALDRLRQYALHQRKQEELGADKVVVEIVAYGPGLGMLKFDAPTNSRVSEAIKSGVTVQACENTMRNQKLVREDMLPKIGYVPSGVVQLMRRQKEGYAYIRP